MTSVTDVVKSSYGKKQYGIHEHEEFCDHVIEIGLSNIHKPSTITALKLAVGAPVFNLRSMLDDYDAYVAEGYMQWQRVGLLMLIRDMWMISDERHGTGHVYCYPALWTFIQLLDPVPGQSRRSFIIHHNWQRKEDDGTWDPWSSNLVQEDYGSAGLARSDYGI